MRESGTLMSRGPRCLVLMGASTGGPRVLGEVLGAVPPLQASVVVVQHMPRFINESFLRTLGRQASMEVRMAVDGEVLREGRVYLAPSEVHCRLVWNRSLQLAAGPPVHYVCPAVDALMLSVQAPRFDQRVIGVLLTGMGKDGAVGMAHLKRLGALTLAQNRETSAVYGMPAEAVRLGGVDRELSPQGIARALAAEAA